MLYYRTVQAAPAPSAAEEAEARAAQEQDLISKAIQPYKTKYTAEHMAMTFRKAVALLAWALSVAPARAGCPAGQYGTSKCTSCAAGKYVRL